MSLSNFSFPTAILFGPGAIAKLPEEMAKRSMARPLLVTDRGLVNTPVFARIRSLVPAGTVVSPVGPQPTEKNVTERVEGYRARRRRRVLGIGGGAPLRPPPAPA